MMPPAESAGGRGIVKGRVSAIGGTIGWNFKVADVPVSTRIKIIREVETENRPHGTIGFLSVSFPLWVGSSAHQPAMPAPIKARF